MNLYLNLARDLELDAVLSISNQYVTSSTEHPVEALEAREETASVAIHHLHS
jgi:hypothetical protein